MRKCFFFLSIISLTLLTACTKKTLDPISFSIKEGNYGNKVSIELKQKQGAEILYTLNGEDPTVKFRQSNRNKYQQPIVLELEDPQKPITYTLKVIARKKGYKVPEVITQKYTIKPQFLAPTFNIDNGLVTKDPIAFKMFYENFELGKAEIRYSLSSKNVSTSNTLFKRFDKGQSPFNNNSFIEFKENKYYKLSAKVISLDPNIMDSDVSTIEFQIDKNAQSHDTLSDDSNSIYYNNSYSENTKKPNNSSSQTYFVEDTKEKGNDTITVSSDPSKNTIYDSTPNNQYEEKRKELNFSKTIEKNQDETIISTILKNNKFYVLSNINDTSFLTIYSDKFVKESQRTFKEEPKKLVNIKNELYLLTINNLYKLNASLEPTLIKSSNYELKDITFFKNEFVGIMIKDKKLFLTNFQNIFKNIDIQYSENIPVSLQVDNDNLYLVTEKDNSKGLTSINLIKYDRDYQEVFNKVYGGGNREFFSSMKILKDNIYILGTTSSYANSKKDEALTFSNFILKISKNGNLINSQSFANEDNEKGEDFIFHDSNFYVLSSSEDSMKCWTLSDNFEIKDTRSITNGRGKLILLFNKNIYSLGTTVNGNNKNIVVSAYGV